MPQDEQDDWYQYYDQTHGDYLSFLEECECRCKACQKMCRVVCKGTVEEMAELITLGYGDRLMLYENVFDVLMLQPAYKGLESKQSTYYEIDSEGCTFWKGGSCEIHHVKPIEGRVAGHSAQIELKSHLPLFLSLQWQQLEGQRLIKSWANEFLNEKIMEKTTWERCWKWNV
jgi:hypothetical protein